MAYKKQEIIDLSLELIKKHKIKKQNHLIAFLPISEATFYSWKMEEIEAVKRALRDSCRVRVCNIVNDWLDSDNPTLQIAGFKQICDDDERKKLSTNYTDITTQGDKIEGAPVMITMAEAKKKLEELESSI